MDSKKKTQQNKTKQNWPKLKLKNNNKIITPHSVYVCFSL